jgi:BlaI family transcriptional regulator, penicillinase repressor
VANKAGLSEAEVDVLKVLWDVGPGPVRAINGELAARGRHWAYTTVSTLLLRLATKGCVASDSSEVPHVYRAVVSREEMLGRRLQDAADQLCDGLAAPLVLALVQRHQFTPDELAGFQRLLDEARAGLGSPRPEPSPSKPKGKGKARGR